MLRRSLWTALACATLLRPAAAARVVNDAEALQLPEFEVSAYVPLVKVARYRMEEERFAPAAVTDGRYVYIVGGASGGRQISRTIERFDPTTGRSEIFARLRVPRMWHMAAVVGEDLYVMGGDSRLFGYDSWTETESSVEIVSLKSGKVRRGPPMPLGLGHSAAVVLGSDIYLIGGTRTSAGARVQTNRVLVLDTLAGTWREGPLLPLALNTTACRVAGDFIVAFGGFAGRSSYADVFVLNPRTGQWSRIESLAKPTSATAVINDDRYIYLFGDYDRRDEVQRYDLKTRNSEVIPVEFEPTRHAAAVKVGGLFCVIGGKIDSADAALDVVQVFARPASRRGAAEASAPPSR